MAKFLETKQTIDNSVKKKKKKQQTQVQPKTQPKKQSQPSQKVQQTTQRFTQKYGGGSLSGGSSRGRSSGTRQRTSQPSQQTLSTNERLRQKYGVGQTRSTSTPTSRYRSQNSRTESRLSQKSQSTVDRLSQKYGTNNAQQREEPEKRYKTKFSAKQQESLNRLDEKYKTGRVTGGKHSFMDNAADYSKNLVKAAGQGLELAGREDLALANRFSNPSSANKFYNRELNATDYEKNKQRMALRQEGLRQKIKQQQQEMSDLAEGQNSKLGRLGVEAAQSAGGMLADTMAGPFSLVHMGARVTEGAQGDVIDKVEPMKKKMLASGNYTPEEVDEMFKDVEKWDFANAIMQGTIEGLTEKMFGGIGLAKKVGGAGILDKVAGRMAGSKLTSNVFGKVLAGTAEEIAEEEIGNPAQAFASNLIYGNKLQAANEDMTRRELQSQSDDIRSQVQSEDDARRIAENLSSDDFMEESIKSYMESGSSKKEATHLAELSRDYLTASLEGDTERMKELQDEMVDIIAGGENSMKEKWTLQDALDVGISTAMMTVATGVPGAMTTSAMGTAYKDANGMDRVRNLAQTALNLNTEESAKAQAIIDSIDNGDELTGTQVYDVMSWAQSAAVEAKEREQVKDDLAEKRMNEEDLMVMPSVVTENGYQLSEATEERFETIAEQTLAKIDELDLDAYKNGGMDAYEIADTVAAYETGTITAEQMNALNIENPENRSVFEEMTGIDLSQYNVTDRNGRINEAASNVAMQTALFAKAADNYVESARIEQENWNNTERGAMAETLSKRIGGQGDKAVYQAMMDVDPRDRSKFELMGRASETVYRFAYNTEGTWDEAEKEFGRRYPSLSNASLKAVFEAAKDDKATANTKYYGEAVKAGEALSKKSMDSAEQVSVAGKFTNDTDVTLKADDQVFLQDMASTFNVNIEAVESMPIRVTDRNGNVVERQANGQFNRDTNTLVINLNADVTMPLRAIVSHELTHSNAYAPDEMLKLLNYIRDSWYRNDPEGYTNAINERKSRYSAEQNLSDLDALEEIVADGAQDFDFWNDSELAERIATEEPTLAAKIINTIKDILRRIRSMLMSDNITNEDYRNALFAHAVDMTEAERLWLNAAKIAVSNKANQDIEAMHESLIEESNNTKLSISDDLSAFKDYVMNRSESSARWTDERIDSLIKEYGASNPDYSQAYAVLMNPRDFLKLTLKDSSLERWNEEANNLPEMEGMNYGERTAFRTQQFSEGNVYNRHEAYPLDEEELRSQTQTPFLTIHSNDGTEVQGHEGRHRMRALMEAGIKSVPVVIRDTDTKYSKAPTETMTLSSQDFGYDPVNNGATVEIRDLVPIKESNREELIQKFGGDAQVRFSINDAEYMDAVERGDMETAQRLVDKAAEKAMPNTKLDGKWYHGTYNDFTVFDFSQGGKNGHAEGYGIYLSNSQDITKEYGTRQIQSYVNMVRPASALDSVTLTSRELHSLIKITVEQEARQMAEDYGDDLEAAKLDTWISNYTDTHMAKSLDAAIDDVIKSMLRFNGNDMDIVQEIMTGMGIRDYETASEFYDILTETTGIDGFTTKWGDEDEMYDPNTPTIAVAFRSSQIKDASPVTYDDEGNVIPLSERFNADNADIRYSVDLATEDALEAEGVTITESGSAVRFSYDSWINTDKDELLNNLLKAGYDRNSAEKWIADVNSVASVILSDMGRLNYEADQFQDALKPNAEYYYTLDLSTLCQKRRLYQGTYNKIMHHLVNSVLMPEDTIRLRQMMDEMGHQVPCGICYEESRKKNEGKFAQRWLNGYGKRWKGYKNQEHTDPYIPTLDEVTTTDGREKLRAEHPEAYESYVQYQKTRGSANPKISYTHTDYRGDILRMTDSEIEKVMHIGGLRIQSFSDFEVPHVIDMMQAVLDMSSRNLTAQAYTKVPAFADIFGGTGIKINLSLIGRLNPETGVLEFDSKEGIDPDEAFRIREKYSHNVGTILVGADDASILAAWADPRVDMVIPFHRSGWGKKEFEKLGLTGYKDFTRGQTERYMMGKKDMALSTASKALGLTGDQKLQGIYAEDYWDYSKTGKENAEAYLALCAEKHYRPVFYQFLHDNGDGTWSLQEDGSTDGYWKSLVDFKMYDNDGVGAKQELVQPNFDMNAAKQIMDEYEGGADTLPVADDVVTEFLKEYKQNHPNAQYKIENDSDVKYSIAMDLDEPYMSAVNSGNMEEAKRLVDEAAKKAGYGTTLYHGTRTFGFTEIRTTDLESMSDGGFYEWSPFFASDSLEVAQTYSSQDDIKRISEAEEPFDEESFDSDWSDAVNDIVSVINSFAGYYNYMDYSVNIFETAFKELQTTSHPVKDITEDLIDNVSEIISELAWEKANFEAEQDPETFEKLGIDIDTYADEIQEGDEANSIWMKLDMVNDMLRAYDLGNYGGGSSGNYELLTNTDNMMQVDAKGHRWNDIPFDAIPERRGYYRTRQLAEIARDEGYDGIQIANLFDDGGQGKGKRQQNPATIYIFFKPESQVKSADPVTYAEDGSVIPLSERFDPTNNDIRYSMPTQDADGNILTDGQMEFFKNSQARDEQGRLVPMYHGTENAGFTIFDSDYGNSSRFFFFADSIDRAKGYSGTHDIFNAKNYETVDEANEYIKSWGNEDKVVQDGDDFIILEDGDEILRNSSLSDLMMEYDEYSGFGGTSSNYKVYLNVENPLVIDAGGNSWDAIPYDDDIVTTNWLAEYAYEEGYDGLIVDNVLDYGLYSSARERMPQRDIVVFSSSQIKDTRNENPTDDPDIRYSFPPETEDEINSRKDYDHASSDDFEILNAYEQMIEDGAAQAEFMNLSDEHLNTAYFMGMMERYGKADKRARKTGKAPKVRSVLANYETEAEKMDAFYRSLMEETSMVYDDEYMEEGRRRMAKSKEDFYSNLNAKWNDRWLSGGEVLNVDSVKGNVRELVKATMANSSADAQYRIDTVNKTLFDMRTAYMFMKQGRQDIASAILYQSAQRMIGDLEFVADDTEYKNYKELRAYLRDTKIEFTDDYWEDIDWNAYRKKNFGRLKLIKGNKNSIDDGTYDELVRQWPEYFSDAEMEKNGYKHDVPGMMQQLDYVLDLNVQPVMEAYSSEAAADLAFSIADDLYTIMENGDRVTSIADRYKEKYDAKTKALKVRHAEALHRMREMRDKGIAEANRRFREYKAQQKESKYHSKYFDSITKSYDKLTERLLTNTKDKHIPEMYKKDLAQLLSAFDLQTVGSKKFEARTGRRSQKTIKMDAIKTVLTNIGARDQLFHVNDSITDIIDRLLGKDAYGEIRPANSIEGKTIDELPAEALKDIDQLLKALIHEFNTYESVRVGAKRQQAADIGTTQIGWCLDHADKFGKGKDYQNVLGGLDKLINLDEVTPAYMFRMIDPNNEGIGLMFKELRRSFGKYVNNQKQLNEWMDEIIGEYHNKGKILGKYGANQIEKWRRANNAIEFEFGTPENPQKVELTPAQMMSIYRLAKRQQALQHMQQGGIVVMPVSFQARMVSDIKKNANYSLPVKLTDANIKTIVSKLTPEQKSVADKLQNLMATKMADWGNEASMNVIGIKLFEDPNYFPIKSDKAAMEKDFTEEQFAQMIRNFGFTKAVMPNANNSIAINDIFDVVAEHCNNMNLYNAYSETMNDFMKVYNYKEYHDDGSHYTVEQAIAHAYSRKATTFISSFMKDLNGNVSKERESGIDAMLNESLGNAKKASVFANGRVALQQPTALARAFYVIKPKYLKGVRAGKQTMQEMFEHSPIALWKSWGYYDINMGKSIEDLMMNEGSVVEDWMSDIYGKLDNRTWAAIWSMCKNETKDLHPEIEEGSDEFWEMVSERMDEVVDLTQVVDSPFHRSHLMRSKQFYHKVLTSFMAEPTLTFNMVRDGILRAKEQLMAGNKREAAHTMSHTLTVFALSAFATSAFAAIWDVVRGKGLPEDDDDKDKDLLSKMQGFYQAWVTNTMENFGDNANILGNIYYVKDIVSLFQGWDQKNLGLQGMKHLADAFRQMKGEDVHSKLTWYENALAGIGYLSGKPLKTIMNDGKTLFKMFGFDIPEPIQASIDWLDRIGKDAKSDTVKDINKGETSTTGVSSNAPADKPVETRLWTYDNAPFHVEDGSLADTFLNHFGINLTKSEIAAAEAAAEKAKREEEIQQITKGLEKYSGEDYDKHLWDKKALEGYSKALEDGDFAKAKEIEDLFLECGGSQSFIDEKKLYHYKKNYLKTITYDPSDVEIENQQRMKEFLLSHGMTESELSEKVYKSQTAKELKVAFLLNDEDAMVEELIPLVRAGLSEADYEKLWKNRKRVDLVKYKESGGKYAERLKSTGKYIWPVSGRIASESEINSYFGHRSSPGGVGSTNHQGIDLDGSMGDPVGAADGGTVVFAGWYGGAGKTVKIQHDDGTITQYSHLSWWGVKEGDVVGQGQTIGNVGSTGNSTGPHLHFGVIKNDSYVDPYEYLFS